MLRILLVLFITLSSLPSHAITAEGETDDNSVNVPADEAAPATDSTDEASKPSPPPMPAGELMAPTSKQLLALLEQSYRNQHSSLRLNDGQEEFFALFGKERRGKPKGAVLILHAKGQYAGWPDNLIALHEELANSGWNSLFISLPKTLADDIPKRELVWPPLDSSPAAADSAQDTGDKPADGSSEPDQTDQETSDNAINPAESDDINQVVTDTDDDTSSDKQDSNQVDNKVNNPDSPTNNADSAIEQTASLSKKEPKLSRPEQEARYQQQVQARIQAGISYLQEQGQFNLALVGEGSGAVYASIYVSNMPKAVEKNSFDAIQALVLINAPNRNPALAPNTLGDMLGSQTTRTLDLVTANHKRNVMLAQKRLHAIASLDRGQRYFQVKLPAVKALQQGHNGPASQRLAKRVRGWLDRYMQGQEINAKRER